MISARISLRFSWIEAITGPIASLCERRWRPREAGIVPLSYTPDAFSVNRLAIR
jgi:hypothetical protein